MKISNLFMGVLFSLLMTMPSYAQGTIVKEKKNKTKTEKVQKERRQKKETQKKKVLNEKKMEQQKPVRKSKLKKVREKVEHTPLDPLTGLPRGSDTNDSSTKTLITFPRSRYRDIALTEIPILIEGTAIRNSDVKIVITTKYKKYGQPITKKLKTQQHTDSDGKWGGVKIYSIKVDEADSKVTHNITAVRVEDDNEKGNTASVSVYSNPEEITSVKITEPKQNLYPVDEGYENGKVTSPITFRGRAIKGHTVEIRIQTSQRNAGNYNDSGYAGSRVIKDWTPVSVDDNGYWETQINTGEPKTNKGSEYTLTVLVRDTKDKSDIKVLHLRR